MSAILLMLDSTTLLAPVGGPRAEGSHRTLSPVGVVNFFNPSLIVIGGGVANSPDQLLAAIRESIYRRSLPLATRELLVHRSSLGGLAGVIGASSMVVDQLFSRASLARWIEAGDPAGSPEVALPKAG
jgi:hypothetical protein